MARSSAAARSRPRAARPARGVAAVPGPGTAPALDQVIHERVRLGIVSALAVQESMTFNELKATVRLTDGNLSVHARRLEVAGYVECVKSFEGRVPRTTYRLTTSGRRALERYLGHMEALIRSMRER